jgi:hypothetical protein
MPGPLQKAGTTGGVFTPQGNNRLELLPKPRNINQVERYSSYTLGELRLLNALPLTKGVGRFGVFQET